MIYWHERVFAYLLCLAEESEETVENRENAN